MADERATSRKTTMLEKRFYENLLRGGQGRSAESIVESAFVVAACLVTAVVFLIGVAIWNH
jgi:hypothetical protein